VDPRPLADKAFIAKSIKDLSEFLIDRGYDHPLLPKNLRGPSRKDVYNMYLFLFRLIDPSFEFGPKFEDDVAAQMRSLRYPFTLSKSTLSAVGTPHTWPHLLGSMSWLIELLTVRFFCVITS
jgi:kinetochore protein NDC80